MERNEISIHEVKVYLAFRNRPDVWMSSRDVAGEVKGVADRTIRAHVLKLVKANILDQAELFPRHKYRMSEKAQKRNVNYVQRLEAAVVVLGPDLGSP